MPGGQANGPHGVEVGLVVGVARGLEPGALDPGPDDAPGKEGHAAEEVLVVVPARIAAAGETAEAVEVELTLEARQLGLVEVLGHDGIDELLGVVDGEGPSVGEPGDDVGQAVPLDLIEEVVQLAGEGDGHPLLSLLAAGAGADDALLLAEDGSLDGLGGAARRPSGPPSSDRGSCA